METLKERGLKYIKNYISENYNINESNQSEDPYRYIDSWIDTHIMCKHHDFNIDSSIELIEAMNYCNQRNDNYNVFSSVLNLNDIIGEFLYEIVKEYNDELF